MGLGICAIMHLLSVLQASPKASGLHWGSVGLRSCCLVLRGQALVLGLQLIAFDLFHQCNLLAL